MGGGTMGCVETVFGDPERSAGSYCLVTLAPPVTDCPRGTYFAVTRSPVDSTTEALYCAPTTLSTCPAVFDTTTCDGDDASSCGLSTELEDSTCQGGRCRSRCDVLEPFSCRLDTEACFDDGSSPPYCRRATM